MGFAVVHLEKAKGSDSGMSAHIERAIAPKNADAERTHLNKELIQFPEGVENRTQSIQHRLATVGLTRKIGKNQVQAIRILLTGTHEDMEKIESDGNLDDWTNDNLDWLRHTYGADNLVSAVLHLDEKTPHIHATVVPIVTTERQRRKREEAVKKKYKTKSTTTPRLCADEVMSRVKLKEYQNSYAESMACYGLQRGIEGSEAKHISTSQYYRDLIQKSETVQQDISSLLALKEQEQAELSKIKSYKSKEQLKNSVADVGSKMMDGFSSMIGTPKMKRIEQENQALKSDMETLNNEISNLNKYLNDIKQSTNQRVYDMQAESLQREESLKREITTLKDQLYKIFDLFPNIKELLNFEKFCLAVGFEIEIIRRLFNREEVRFSGDIYSHEYRRKFTTNDSTAKIVNDRDCNNRPSLHIDGVDSTYWFRHKKSDDLKQMGINIPEPRPKRGGYNVSISRDDIFFINFGQ